MNQQLDELHPVRFEVDLVENLQGFGGGEAGAVTVIALAQAAHHHRQRGGVELQGDLGKERLGGRRDLEFLVVRERSGQLHAGLRRGRSYLRP